MLTDASKVGNAAIIYNRHNNISYIIQSTSKHKKKLEQRCVQLALNKTPYLRIKYIFSDYIALRGNIHNCVIMLQIKQTYPDIIYRYISGMKNIIADKMSRAKDITKQDLLLDKIIQKTLCINNNICMASVFN